MKIVERNDGKFYVKRSWWTLHYGRYLRVNDYLDTNWYEDIEFATLFPSYDDAKRWACKALESERNIQADKEKRKTKKVYNFKCDC